MPDRLKGQDVTVTVVSTTNGLETAFGDVKSLDVQFDRTIIDEEYLGQYTNQKDDVYNGVSGTIEFHNRSADTFSIITRINAATQDRLPGESIQIVATFRFPVGGTRRMLIPDCKFGEIPISTGARSELVNTTLNFAADDAQVLASP